MTLTELKELRDQVRGLKGPDREVDARLWCLVTPNREFVAMATGRERWEAFDPYAVGRNSTCIPGMVFRRTDFKGTVEDIQKHGGEFQQFPSSPAYTGSFDAAIAFSEKVLPGYDYILERTNGGLTISCRMGTADADKRVFADTLPLAIIDATLTALIEMME